MFLFPAMLQAADPARVTEEAQYHILAGELAGQRGQAQIAAQEYLQALRLAPSLEIAERATQVAAYAGNAALAKEAASLWVKLDPKKLEPRFVLMRVAVSVDQLQEAIEQALFIADRHPNGSDQAFRDISGALIGNAENADTALAVMAGLKEEYSESAELPYATGMLALKLERPAEAVIAADQALAFNEDWAEVLLLKATALMSQGKSVQARAVVNGADLRDSQQINLHLAFARLLLQAELGEAAVDQYQHVLALDDEQPEALYAMGILQLNLGRSDEAYNYFFTLYDEVGAKQDIAAYYLGGIEESRENYAQALTWYEKVTEGDRLLDAAQRKAFVLYKLGKLDEARAWLRDLREVQPDSAVQFYLVEGELLIEARQLEEAMGLYNEALELNPDDLDLLYGRSIIAERLGRFTLSERDLRSILQLEPNDARSLNALGYILANHTQRYEEALELITQALEQTPDDAAVIDSMGWVQYRLGDLDAALEYLNRAFDRMPDPEVAAHLGEVLWELGRQEQAQSILEQALQDAPDNVVVRDTIKRLMQ